MSIDIKEIRKDFPILSTQNRGKPLIYLDNAASSQKPQCVIDALSKYYSFQNSNVHRGIYDLAESAENEYQNARKTIADWFNVTPDEIVFVRGATEALNLVAHGLIQTILQPNDQILLTQMEHHANIVPWQILGKSKNIKIIPIGLNEDGSLDREELSSYLCDENTKILSLCHISNSLGTINPVKEIIEEAHKFNVKVVIDGAQSVPHGKINLKELNCDFFAFSGHKVFGPMGIGVLFGKKDLLDNLPPYQGGGDMIDEVSFDQTTFSPAPQRFEAGTPNVAGAIGLASAIKYLAQFNINDLEQHENNLLQICHDAFEKIPEITIHGKSPEKAAVLSFSAKNVHPHDLASLLDSEGIAIRTGHHCCQPLMRVLGVQATARASFALYNTEEEAEFFVKTIKKSLSILG
tara:strand:- start:2619 stop:3839 length:1221 start_codon:yes stop_codon:yes gene_type:complete